MTTDRAPLKYAPLAIVAASMIVANFTVAGWLPVAIGLAVAFVAHAGALMFGDDDVTTQRLGGATLLLALASGGTRLAALAGIATPPVLVGGLALVTALAIFLARRAGVRPSWSIPRVVDATSLGFAITAAVASIAIVAAAYLLPVWQYDSLNYHLPFVNLVLQEGTSSAVPLDLRYVGTYPHAIEWIFVAMRATLPDDRLVDLAQAPFGVLGAAVIAALGRQLGARPSVAFAAAVAWLVMPAVLLQLPTNYIDVATATSYLLAAYFLLRPTIEARHLCAAGMAIGLFLGSKPSAPLGTMVLVAVLLVRVARSSAWTAGGAACLLALGLGVESYVQGLLVFGNPVWPVEVHLGPIHLPGPQTMEAVLSSGAGTERAHGSLLARVVASWTSLYATPVFDMRVGGFGPLGLLALPVAAVAIVRRRAWLLGVLWLGAVLSPDPAICRYVLAFPALALAITAAELEHVAARARVVACSASAALAFVSLAHASRGFTGEGPRLSAYPGMTWAERGVAVGADGRPDRFVAMRERLLDGESIAFDATADLPYLLWRPDLSSRTVYLSSAATSDELLALLERERARFAVIASDGVLARDAGERLSLLFRCKSAPCNVYEVR